jgi:hypothetical protein
MSTTTTTTTSTSTIIIIIIIIIAALELCQEPRNAILQKTSDSSVILYKKFLSFSQLQSSKGFKTKILPPSSSGTT